MSMNCCQLCNLKVHLAFRYLLRTTESQVTMWCISIYCLCLIHEKKSLSITQNIPCMLHIVCGLIVSLVFWYQQISAYPSRYVHLHYGNNILSPVPQPWWILNKLFTRSVGVDNAMHWHGLNMKPCHETHVNWCMPLSKPLYGVLLLQTKCQYKRNPWKYIETNILQTTFSIHFYAL